MRPPASERRLILMIAIGQRPWAPITAALFERYAHDVCSADFRLDTALPGPVEFPLPDMPDHPGRPHKRVYAAKAFLPWRAMAQDGYDRVLVVDDSCCVTPDAPDVFARAARGACGYTQTSAVHAEMSFETIRAFVRAKGEADVPYDPAFYMNSGVMLYDRTFVDALALDRIVAARDLLFAAYPHQTLSYYLLRRGGVPMTLLPKSFNRLPASQLPPKRWAAMTDVVPHLGNGDDTFIYHVTGAFKHRDRVIPALACHLLSRVDPAAAARFAKRHVRTARISRIGAAAASTLRSRLRSAVAIR